ncbi:hypothetical protein [Streptomyces albidochromogenes]|uniref:Lipoprotein n=1 Tax=Streptomyces albidochromogenes TaxID=329524 RepID=A0ABW6FKV2_9ACTN
MGASGLTACGDEAKDDPFKGQKADAIAAKAVKATNGASSVHMAGTAHQEGGTTIKVDFKVDTQDNCTGTLSGQGTEAEVIKTSETGYVKGNDAFWQNSLKAQPGAEKMISQLRGRWVKTPADETSTRDICDKQAFLAAMDNDKSERKGMTKGRTTTVDGQEAIVLKKKDGDQTLTLYVATKGKPYILKTTATGGENPSTMNFTDYNKTVKATPPPADKVVDPKKLAAKQA